MSELERKTFASPAAGSFEARVYRVDSEPDGDGDIIARGAVKDGHSVQISFSEHDTLLSNAEPVGHATLHHVGSAVHAVGQIDNSADGLAFKANLQRFGAEVQWSVGWVRSTVKSRPPTASELAVKPDTKRVILGWDVREISPVAQGSCGPSCRTLGVKCAKGGCQCSKKKPEPRPADLVEWIPPNDQRRVATLAFREGRKRWGVESDPVVRWFKRNGRCSGQYLQDRNEIFVEIGLDAEQTALVVLHELRHAFQAEHSENFGTRSHHEGDAEGYARVMARQLVAEGLLA